MKLLTFPVTIILLSCGPALDGGHISSNIKYLGGGFFEVSIDNPPENFCVSDFFLSSGDESFGEAIEVVDENGELQDHNPGYPISNTPAKFLKIRNSPFLYRTRSATSLDEKLIYRARLNISIFKCDKKDLDDFIYYSFDHRQLYPEKSGERQVLSDWIEFQP